MSDLKNRDYRSAPGTWLVDEPIRKLLEQHPPRGTGSVDYYWSFRHQLFGLVRFAVTAARAAYILRITREARERELDFLQGLISQVEHFVREQKSNEAMLLRAGLPVSSVHTLPEAKAGKHAEAFLAALREQVQSQRIEEGQGDATDEFAKQFVEAMYVFWVRYVESREPSPLMFELMTAVCRDANLWRERDGPKDDLSGWLQRKFRSTIRPSKVKGPIGET